MPRRRRTACATTGCKRAGPYSIGLGLCTECGSKRKALGGAVAGKLPASKAQRRSAQKVGRLSASKRQRAVAKRLGKKRSMRDLKRAGMRSGLKRSAPRVFTINTQWLNRILEGQKTWEIRSNRLKQLGPTHLSPSGSRHIVGSCDVVDSISLTRPVFRDNVDKHLLRSFSDVKYKNPHAWVLANVKPIDPPLLYKHKRGAVVFVKTH